MVKSRIFDNTQLLKEHPELPHYKEEVVCFRSEYKDRSYPANECYFNRELYMIFVLEGRSEILLNGEFIAIEPNMLLIHGANYLTEHLYSSRDIKKLFKFYSKIILWQRYASWLRACQPCIHSQWSVS